MDDRIENKTPEVKPKKKSRATRCRAIKVTIDEDWCIGWLRELADDERTWVWKLLIELAGGLRGMERDRRLAAACSVATRYVREIYDRTAPAVTLAAAGSNPIARLAATIR